MRILDLISYLSKWLILLIVFDGILLVGLLDYHTGHMVDFSLFYLIPILIVSWIEGGRAGFAASILSAIVWLIADTMTQDSYTYAFVPYCNAGTRLVLFLVVSHMSVQLSQKLKLEQALSRTDDLTGLLNRCAFLDVVSQEMAFSRNHGQPLSVAYIDIDNFEAVNDSSGHVAGDELLCLIARFLEDTLPESDHAARVAGDEFAVLLPNSDEALSLQITECLREKLLTRICEHGWALTISIGLVTSYTSSESAEDTIRAAEGLMYLAKESGKDSIWQDTMKHPVSAAAPSDSQELLLPSAFQS